MDHVIARVRDRKNNYRKLLSDKEIFNLTIEEYVTYSPETLLEDGQWYRIEEFSQKEYCIDILKENWDSTAYDRLRSIDAAIIDYICSYQDENVFYFQRIYKNNILTERSILNLGDNINLERRKNILIINECPDAVYYKDQDCLYFKKLETISSIFKGIDVLYREATQGEVENFFCEKFISLSSDYTASKVGKANRRRLAMAMDTLNKLEEKQKKQIFLYTNKYYPGLKYNGSSFMINNEEDLKNLLYGIEQRFYTTPVTNENRVANSVSIII